jgi:hypothetical protein
MGWLDTWLPNTQAALTQILGSGGTSADGTTMPAIRSIDTITILGQITPGLIDALKRYTTGINGADASQAAVLSSLTTTDGTPNFNGSIVGAVAAATLGGGSKPYVDAATYLSYAPKPNEHPRVRCKTMEYLDGDTYALWVKDTDSQDLAYYGFVSQAIADYQSAVDAAASAITENAVDITQPAPDDSNSAFWSALVQLCSDLDTLNEVPPATLSADLMAKALGYSLHQTEQWVGKTVAQAAGEIGELAANVTEGFFSTAGLMSIVVVGLVIFMYVR